MIKIRTLYEIIAEKDPSEIIEDLKAELAKYEALGTPEELESWKTNGIKASKDLESYTQQLQEYIAKQSEQPEWLKIVIEKAQKYDAQQKQFEEAEKSIDRINNKLDAYSSSQSEQPEWLKVVIEKAKKYDEMQKGLAEAKKKLDNYKEPDYGPIETFDDAPGTGKTPPEDLKAKLAKYEALGTPEELKKVSEQVKAELTASPESYKDLIARATEADKKLGERIDSLYKQTLLLEEANRTNGLIGANKALIDELQTKLAKYEAIGTPEEVKYWKEQLIVITKDMKQSNALLEKALKLADYEPSPTPQEITENFKKALEQAKEGEELKQRIGAAIKAVEEHKPTYQKKTPGEIKKMFGLE